MTKTSDEPRFLLLLSVNHDDIKGSFVPPDDDCFDKPGYTSDPVGARQEAQRD